MAGMMVFIAALWAYDLPSPLERQQSTAGAHDVCVEDGQLGKVMIELSGAGSAKVLESTLDDPSAERCLVESLVDTNWTNSSPIQELLEFTD